MNIQIQVLNSILFLFDYSEAEWREKSKKKILNIF